VTRDAAKHPSDHHTASRSRFNSTEVGKNLTPYQYDRLDGRIEVLSPFNHSEKKHRSPVVPVRVELLLGSDHDSILHGSHAKLLVAAETL
jgi:hypothetical protein